MSVRARFCSTRPFRGWSASWTRLSSCACTGPPSSAGTVSPASVTMVRAPGRRSCATDAGNVSGAPILPTRAAWSNAPIAKIRHASRASAHDDVAVRSHLALAGGFDHVLELGHRAGLGVPAAGQIGHLVIHGPAAGWTAEPVDAVVDAALHLGLTCVAGKIEIKTVDPDAPGFGDGGRQRNGSLHA